MSRRARQEGECYGCGSRQTAILRRKPDQPIGILTLVVFIFATAHILILTIA
jgi:hypothetical protein